MLLRELLHKAVFSTSGKTAPVLYSLSNQTNDPVVSHKVIGAVDLRQAHGSPEWGWKWQIRKYSLRKEMQS